MDYLTVIRCCSIIALFVLPSTSLCAKDVDFENDVMPVLTRYGCNAGACHGKSGGQGGFQLSLLGFDPDGDYDIITKQAGGRRVLPAVPDKSLMLTKPAALIPHGGGRRIERGSAAFLVLRDWIENGVPRRLETTPKLVGVKVEPKAAVLENGAKAQLKVTANYDDGSTRDVTQLTQFLSNES
ncbi:MAG: S-layer protein, partial [Planctomycetaceae bacterium]